MECVLLKSIITFPLSYMESMSGAFRNDFKIAMSNLNMLLG